MGEALSLEDVKSKMSCLQVSSIECLVSGVFMLPPGEGAGGHHREGAGGLQPPLGGLPAAPPPGRPLRAVQEAARPQRQPEAAAGPGDEAPQPPADLTWLLQVRGLQLLDHLQFLAELARVKQIVAGRQEALGQVWWL